MSCYTLMSILCRDSITFPIITPSGIPLSTDAKEYWLGFITRDTTPGTREMPFHIQSYVYPLHYFHPCPYGVPFEIRDDKVTKNRRNRACKRGLYQQYPERIIYQLSLSTRCISLIIRQLLTIICTIIILKRPHGPHTDTRHSIQSVGLVREFVRLIHHHGSSEGTRE